MRHLKLVSVGLSLSLLAGCVSTGGENLIPSSTDDAAKADSQASIERASASTALSAAPAACTAIAGPPAKPDKIADFAAATAENVGRNVARNVIFGQIPGGGLLATKVVRTTEDLNGVWKATDGSTTCGCTVDLRDRGLFGGANPKMIPKNCSSQLAGAKFYSLGHSFTGYDAPLTLFGSDGKTVVAKLNRDGIHYFSGALSDGTAVTIWRRQ